MKLPPMTTGSSKVGATTLAEINVVPLIDIMLVLLIVFMISAPMMQQGTSIDLPKANTGALPDIENQIVLEVSAQKRVTMNGKDVSNDQLTVQLRDIASAQPDIQVFVKADQKVEYGFIAQVIAKVKRAGIPRVGLVTLPEN